MKYPLYVEQNIAIEDVFLLLDTHEDLIICYLDESDICLKFKQQSPWLTTHCQVVLVSQEILEFFKLPKVPTFIHYHKGVEEFRFCGTLDQATFLKRFSLSPIALPAAAQRKVTSVRNQSHKITNKLNDTLRFLQNNSRATLLFYRHKKEMLAYVNQTWVQRDVDLIVEMSTDVQEYFRFKSDTAFVFYDRSIPVGLNFWPINHDQFLYEKAQAFGHIH